MNKFNGLKNRTIFCLWTGQEIMSENRLKALWSIFKNTGRPIAFITQNNLNEWIHPEYPLHPAYHLLTSTHKSDYLRCYLMHHYGGGYTDIKFTDKKWEQFFLLLENSQDHMALGYKELENGMPQLNGETAEKIRAAHNEIIGLCAFIFKPHSKLTEIWYNQVHDVLDIKFELLKSHPGKFSLDQTGLKLPNGEPSSYPLRWSEILGEIIHPILYEYRHNLIKTNIEPSFTQYR